MFAEDYPFPDVEEGEVVAILNAGGYIQAMSSTHCLRPMGDRGLSRAGGAAHERRSRAGPTSPGGRLPAEVGRRRARASSSPTPGSPTRASGTRSGTRSPPPPRRALRPARLRPRRRRRARRFSNRADLVAVMDAAGLDRAVLVGLLAGGLDRHRHGARVPGPRSGPRLGLRRDLRARDRGDARRGGRVRAGGGARGGEGLGGAGRPRRRDLGRRVRAARGPGARRGARRRPARWPSRPTSRRSRTATRSCSTRRRSGGSGSCAMPVLAIDGRARRVRRPRLRRDCSSRPAPGARRIDLPDVAHMPSLERPEWFTETLLAFLARSTRRLGARRGRPTRPRARSRSG